ncbi:uncharacterized protein RCH25_052385 [Pelodytes ibericus]
MLSQPVQAQHQRTCSTEQLKGPKAPSGSSSRPRAAPSWFTAADPSLPCTQQLALSGNDVRHQRDSLARSGGSAAMPTGCVTLSCVQILEGIAGFLGTLTLMASALTRHWYNNRGVWETDPFSEETSADNLTSAIPTSRVRKAQLFFTGLSFIMAAASFCLCVIFLFCWKPPRHDQETREPPRPGSLLLAVLLPTGLFFLLGWSIFTWQHWDDLQTFKSSLGYSYWLGASAWCLLLVFLPATYLVDVCTSMKDPQPLYI